MSGMKNLIGALLFLALAFYVGTELYERAKDKDWLSAPSRKGDAASFKKLPSKSNAPRSPSVQDWKAPSYPAKLELANADGKQLRVTLLGRDSTHIYFLRNGDEEEFRYPIQNLNEFSREKVMLYPESGMNKEQKESRKLHALYVKNLEERIAQIDVRLSAIEKEYKQSNSQTLRRTLMRQYEELKQERLAFELEIGEYQ